MIEDMPGWVRIAGVVVAVLLIPVVCLVGHVLERFEARRRPKGWRRHG